MSYLNHLIYYASVLIFIFLFLQSSYLFVFALAGRLISPKNYKHAGQSGRFVIYLFSCNDENAAEAAKAALSLSYPTEKKHIVVIAASLQPATIKVLHELPVQITEISLNSSKAEVMQAAVQQTTGNFDYALMLDAAHVCTKGFLYRMNDVLQSGYLAVQCQRVIKRTSTALGLLDAISEGINTHIFCKSHRLLGLSACLSGSGVAISFSLFKEIVLCLSANGDFTTELELHLLRRCICCAYAQKALLYEEQEARQSASEHQCHQWASAQSHTLQSYISDGILQVGKGNVDFLNKVFHILLLPRILMLGITPFAVLLSLLHGPALSAYYWFYLWMVTYAAIFMSIPARYITNRFLKAIFLLPSVFLRITKLLFKLKNGNAKVRHPLYSDIRTHHAHRNSVA